MIVTNEYIIYQSTDCETVLVKAKGNKFTFKVRLDSLDVWLEEQAKRVSLKDGTLNMKE